MSDPAKILLVDDDDVQLQVIGHAIQSAGDYTVLTSTSPITAFQMAEKHLPDIILSDYFMPEQDGFTFCRKIKEHPQLRRAMFILLTSASTIDQKVRGLDLGADDYIAKPFNTEELMSRVRAALRIKALTNELEADKRKLSSLYAEVEESFMGVIALLTHLIGQRVPSATHRGERAAVMACWVGERLGLDERELKMLEIAAKLHEIGKVSFSDQLLKKPAPALTEVERSAMAHFPVVGQSMLKGIPRLRDVALWIRCQMENFDGTGYPDKLQRDQIPLPARILRGVNLVEAECALHASNVGSLVAALMRCKGTALDPHIVQLFAEYVQVIENPAWREGKKQVSIYELKPGMVIANDLTTGSGTKLLSDKSTISDSILERILAHHQYDPILNNIYVYEAA